MKDKNYSLLMKKADVYDETEKMTVINKRIDDILRPSPDTISQLEALICKVEGESNVTGYYSVAGIAYAIMVVALTVIAEKVLSMVGGIVLLSVLLAIIAIWIHRKDAHRTFVLNCLKYRYEKEKSKADLSNANETVIEEDDEYTEYIVRVKKK